MEENEYIPLADCVDRMLYRLSSRNLSLGVYCAATKGFIGLRSKFGSRFLFTEYHWDTGAPYGTACPLEALEPLPPHIVLAEDLGRICDGCQRPVRFVQSGGGSHGHDVHDDGTPGCPCSSTTSMANEAFFDYLADKLAATNGSDRTD